MQFTAKHAEGCFCARRIFGKDRRPRKAKLIKAFELPLQVFLRLAKLAAVAFVKDEDNLLPIYLKISLRFHQIVKLLDGGDDDLVVICCQVPLKACRAV